MSREREEVIPVVKEELEVGKRVTERRYRVKSYIVERPIEKTVTVRDERVEIEHRPISRTGDLSMPQEREIEVIERHEEPFAEKRVTGNRGDRRAQGGCRASGDRPRYGARDQGRCRQGAGR